MEKITVNGVEFTEKEIEVIDILDLIAKAL